MPFESFEDEDNGKDGSLGSYISASTFDGKAFTS